MGEIYQINSLKFNGKLHRSWLAELIKVDSDFLFFKGVFDKAVNHSLLGEIKRGTISYEFFWLDRWYNIFRFHEPNGEFRNFYCNISQPPTLKDFSLSFIDYDIDILVQKDFSYEILDEDEFAENSQIYKYGIELIEKVSDTVIHLEKLIQNKQFPFNFGVI